MGPDVFLIWGPVLVCLGLLTGFLSGFLGVGGGIILVPGLLFGLNALGFPPEHVIHGAIGTSLAIIVFTSMSSARVHHRHGAVRFDLIKKIAPGIVMGIVLGAAIADRISEDMLIRIFSIALLCLGLLMLADPARFSFVKDIPGQPWPGLAGVVIGSLSTLIGIGGATLSVPYMAFCRVPIRQAVGTASALSLVISVPATIGYIVIGQGQGNLPPLSLGYINLLAVALVVPGSIMAAPWGASVTHRVSVQRLRQVFSVFVMIVALKMLYGVIDG